MERETELEILAELLGQLDTGRNVDAGVRYRVPTRSYVDPALAGREWRTFFQGHPQLVGLTGDLPEPGGFFTTDNFGTPVLATRDDHGRFRAFLNACRHRGVRVANAARGSQRRFMCPFHNWTYGNDGTLVGIPRERDFGPVDRACHGLIELPAEERHGLLWVHPQPDGELDVGALLGDLDQEIAEWQVGDLVYQGESVLDKQLNWKLANDTFGETYHFGRLHKQTLGQIFYGDALSYRIFGRNHRFVFASRGIDALRELPQDAWRIDSAANVLYYLFPNIQFNVGRDYVSLIKIYPDPEDPNRSITRIGHYFSRAAIAEAQSSEQLITAENVYQFDERAEETAFTLEATMEVFDSTIEQEDYRMGETTQQAARNGLLTHLIFGRNEPALHHYHNTFREALNLPPLECIDDPAPSRA